MKYTSTFKGSALVLLPTLCIIFPALVEAQQTFRQFASLVVEFLNLGAGFIMALALLAFIIGAIRYIATAGDDKSRESSKYLLIWGTIALTAMLAVWGLVGIIRETFLTN